MVSSPRLIWGLSYKTKTPRHTAPAMAAGVTKRLWEIGDIVDVLEAIESRSSCCLNQTDTPENEEAVRDLRRTAFSSQCWPTAGSLKRRFVDWELTKPEARQS
jgi:hypothetical protein